MYKRQASFSGNYFKGYPAITCNKYGKGIVYYVATVPEQSIADKLMKEVISNSSIKVPAQCNHPLVEIAGLKDTNGKQYIYIVNFSDEDQIIEFKIPVLNIMTGKKYPVSAFVKAMDYLLVQVNQ